MTLDSRDIFGGTLQPKAIHFLRAGETKTQAWNGTTPIPLNTDGLVVSEWAMAK